MIIAMTVKHNTSELADDVLAGWQRLDNFILGYTVKQKTGTEVIGLFDVIESPLQRGQRVVLRVARERVMK